MIWELIYTYQVLIKYHVQSFFFFFFFLKNGEYVDFIKTNFPVIIKWLSSFNPEIWQNNQKAHEMKKEISEL